MAKKLVAETRPCYSLPHDYFVDACPARTDYAFPSGHSTTAFATVAALIALPAAYLTSRTLGRIAVPLVTRLRTGVLQPALTAAPAGAHAAR